MEGEMDAAMMMDPPAMEDKPLMMDEKMMEEKKSEKSKKSNKSEKSKKSEEEEDSEDEEWPKNNLEPCCCCLCVCSNEKTSDLTCCGCLPIKCGIVSLGIIYFTLTVVLVTWNFFMMLNEYIDWWFPVVSLALLIPLVIGTCFFVVFFTKDKRASRGKLGPACQLAIISLSLVAVWNLVYFIWLYKKDKDTVYQGMNEGPYKKTPKKVYVFSILAETIVLVAFFTYAICVTERYYDAMLPEDKKK